MSSRERRCTAPPIFEIQEEQISQYPAVHLNSNAGQVTSWWKVSEAHFFGMGGRMKFENSFEWTFWIFPI